MSKKLTIPTHRSHSFRLDLLPAVVGPAVISIRCNRCRKYLKAMDWFDPRDRQAAKRFHDRLFDHVNDCEKASVDRPRNVRVRRPEGSPNTVLLAECF